MKGVDEFSSNALLRKSVCNYSFLFRISFRPFVLARQVMLKLGEAQFDQEYLELCRPFCIYEMHDECGKISWTSRTCCEHKEEISHKYA